MIGIAGEAKGSVQQLVRVWLCRLEVGRLQACWISFVFKIVPGLGNQILYLDAKFWIRERSCLLNSRATDGEICSNKGCMNPKRVQIMPSFERYSPRDQHLTFWGNRPKSLL